MSEVERLTAADQDAFEAACHLAFHEVAHPDDIAMDQRVTEPERTLGGPRGRRDRRHRRGPEPRADGPRRDAAGRRRLGDRRRARATRAAATSRRDRCAGCSTTPARRARPSPRCGRRRARSTAASASAPATRAMRYELQLDRVALRPRRRAPAGAAAGARARRRARADPRRCSTACGPGGRGCSTAPGAWWDRRIHDPEHRRDGAGPLRAAVQPGPDGEPAGYALFAAKTSWDDHGPAGSVTVQGADRRDAGGARRAVALPARARPRAHAAVAARARPRSRSRTSSRATTRSTAAPATACSCGCVDVDAALAARSYAIPVDLVLEVDDPFCPWNTGRHRLHDGGCEPTDAPADLALGAEALGAIYLGGTPLTRARRGRPRARAAPGRARRGRDGVPRRRRAVVPGDLLTVLLLAADAAAAGAGLGGRALR